MSSLQVEPQAEGPGQRAGRFWGRQLRGGTPGTGKCHLTPIISMADWTGRGTSRPEQLDQICADREKAREASYGVLLLRLSDHDGPFASLAGDSFLVAKFCIELEERWRCGGIDRVVT